MKNLIPLLVLALSMPLFAQVPTSTTSFDIPATVCGLGGPEACTYYPDGIIRNGYGRFQTGAQFTQLVFDSYDAEDCWNPFNYAPTQKWDVSDTDITPPALPTPVYPVVSYSNQSDVKLFVMNCAATTLQGGHSLQLGHTVHAEIYAYSYAVTAHCGRTGVLCHYTRWQTIDGSFVEDEE